MDEVAAVAAAGVDDAHAGGEIAAEDLVEDVDVDGAELVLDRGGDGVGQETFFGGVGGVSGPVGLWYPTLATQRNRKGGARGIFSGSIEEQLPTHRRPFDFAQGRSGRPCQMIQD